MKHVIILITVIGLLASCVENADNENREEVSVVEKDIIKDTTIAPEQITESIQAENTKGRYRITAEKVFFHHQPDKNTIRKSYVIRNDEVDVQMQSGAFVLAVYTSSKGKKTEGWLLLDDLQLITNKLNTSEFREVSLPFVGEKCGGNSRMGYCVTIKANGSVIIRHLYLGSGTIEYNGKYASIIKTESKDFNYKIYSDKMTIVDRNGNIETGCDGIADQPCEWILK
ncbi:MAG: hypothetical protein M9958_05940 [Chitinophagales bacterium]|nr:hypothetical protein [Chitinophagales bacterium]